ncbi:MAG TPA: LysR family transcriptional regulator [Candidatus Aquabacterium excrementipullorum]|nr:LysR family transcriptional regulator [Candidatus Aquabacterium excrementipullorum]
MPSPSASPPSSLTQDRIALMQTFVHIVEAGSLSAAAQQMGATQPTVSRRLQALERSLGLRLLRRSTHAMQLTDDGERCYTRAKELLERWATFEADLRGARDEPEGTLRVVAPHALGQDLLIPPLADYLRAFPRVSVDWLLHDRRPDFIAEDIDCAIQVGEVTDPSVVAIKLSEVPRIVVAAPSVVGEAPPSHPSDLATWPWLSLRTFYRNEIVLTPQGGGTSCRLPIRPRLGTDSLYALRTAAVSGLGVCAASAWLLRDDLAEGRLVHLVPDWVPEPLPVYLVYPHARFYPAKLKRFIDVMRVAVASSVGGLWNVNPVA